MDRILGALNAIKDAAFHATACKALAHVVAEEVWLKDWLDKGIVVLAGVLEHCVTVRPRPGRLSGALSVSQK